MIPNIPESALLDVGQIDLLPQPSRTYELDLQSGRILSTVDGLAAATQMVYKTFYTERYAWLIYNWDYGMELEQYIGRSMDFVMADIQLAITEALQVDDRFLSVQDFKMEQKKIDALYVEFTVSTTEGSTTIGLEVPL